MTGNCLITRETEKHINVPEPKDDTNISNLSRGINLTGGLCETADIVHIVAFWGISLDKRYIPMFQRNILPPAEMVP
jgi:hypothetical protein